MKTTFFAILASAAVVLASPLPGADADAHQGQPAPYSSDPAPPPPQGWVYPKGDQPQWPGHGGQDEWDPPAPAPYGNDQPAYYPVDPPVYSDDPHSGIEGSIIQGGHGGVWAPAPPNGWGAPVGWGVEGGWSAPPPPPTGGYKVWQGVAPPPQFGYQAWPAPGGFPSGSPFNGGDGVNTFGNTCSNTQQAVSCCSGGDSEGLLGGLLPGTCTLNLLSKSCSQSVKCCDTQTQNGLINIGLQCSSIL